MTAKRIKSKTKSSNNEEEKKTQHHKDSAIKKDNNVEHKQEEKAENKEAELIKEGLEAIYGEDKMDFSKLERSGSRISNILLTIVITLTILAGAAWSGFFVYMKFFSNQNAQLFTLDIEMEENIKSGQPTNIEILYSNPTAVQIASLELDVRLPASFKVTGMSPLPDDFDEFLWDIGTLPANSNGKIDIEGIWITEVPSSTPVQIFANFRPSNFNSDFQEIETKYVSTTESVITSKISGPDEISPGQIGEYIITIKNDSEETFENIAVELNLPDGFYLEDSNPSVQAGEAPEWAFANLTNSEPIEIEFSGIFAADIEGFQYFNVNTGIQENKKTYIQNSTQGFTDLLKTDISLSMVANGAINDAIVGMGDDLRVTLALENQSEVAIDNADLLLDFQSNLPMPIDWSKSNLDGGTVTQDGIYWSNDTLGALAAGEKRILNISFPVNETIPSTKADNFTLTASSSVGSFIIRSSPISVSIATDASFEAIAKYFNDSGSPIGSGPIPPEVGQQTSYRIYWQINNSLHDLDAITVEATLPPNVEWRSGASSDLGSVTFDSTTNTVQWKISNLTSSLTSVGANFLLELTPSSSDINKFAKLLSGSTFKAIDSTTRASIQSTTGSLTTDLEYDPYAEGKGIVIE